MTTIYSGLVVQSFGHFWKPWTKRAVSRQQSYCDRKGFNYCLMTDIYWGAEYPVRESWTYATLIKLVAIDRFLETNEEYFTWIDLDIYPTAKADDYELPECNLLYAPFTSWSHCEQPGHEHMRCKREWCGHASDYYAVSSGMFRLKRESVEDFWNFVNVNHDIKTQDWWDAFYEKQTAFSKESPWMYGTDECFLEEWLNLRMHQGFQFFQLTDDIQSVDAKHDPIFMHYYGPNKENYPAN